MKTKWIALMTALAVVAPLITTGATVADDEQLKVDLNRAGIEELIKLPGVGEIVAERIVAYRDENGGFKTPEELMNVRGIGEKTYLKIEPHLTVSAPQQKEE